MQLDPVYFSQALHNIVQNCIEAMPAGGKIKITTQQDGPRCQVVVADTGPGVPNADEHLMFLPFFSTKEQGMGLGLTVAERIMKQHSGEIKVMPNYNGGTAVALVLPKPNGNP